MKLEQNRTGCHFSLLIQLLYEFKEVIGDSSILETMEGNWLSATEKVLGEETDKLPPFSSDHKFLRMLNKNIYHRKPNNLPIIFVEVCIHIFSATLMH